MKRFAFVLALAALLVVSAPAQASHTWGNLGFVSEDATTNSSATCGEATYYTAGAINDIYAGSPVNGAHQANCPGPHPNASAKWQQWVNAAGTRIFDCLYDEDTGLIEVECRDFEPLRPGFSHTGWEQEQGTLQITPNGVDGTAGCGEANIEVAGFISEVWGLNAISGAYSGNCAGPHPNGSAKWVQWGGPGGNVMYDCLYDEDPPTIVEFSCTGPDFGRLTLGR